MFHGNVTWDAPLPPEFAADRDASVACLRDRGYQAGAFDKDDGVWFNAPDGSPYDATRGEVDVRACFPWLTFP